MNIPTLPTNAPFSEEQRAWLNGYLASFLPSILSSAASGGATIAEEAVSSSGGGQAVTVAFGSQTGNSEGLAKKLVKKLTASGHSPSLVDMADLSVEGLKEITNLFIITSTYGDGEAPDNAEDFHSTLLASEEKLENVNYSVLALGDSEYPDFCQCGIEIDAKLTELGATRVSPRIDCDVEFDDEFIAWSELLIAQLAQVS